MWQVDPSTDLSVNRHRSFPAGGLTNDRIGVSADMECDFSGIRRLRETTSDIKAIKTNGSDILRRGGPAVWDGAHTSGTELCLHRVLIVSSARDEYV